MQRIHMADIQNRRVCRAPGPGVSVTTLRSVTCPRCKELLGRAFSSDDGEPDELDDAVTIAKILRRTSDARRVRVLVNAARLASLPDIADGIARIDDPREPDATLGPTGYELRA